MAVVNVTDESFGKEVLQASVPVVVEFSNPGTNEHNEADHSARTNAILDGLADDYGDKIKVVRVALDKCPESAALCGVSTAPTLFFIQRASDFHLKFWIKGKIDGMLG